MITKHRMSSIFLLVFSVVTTTNASAQLGGVAGGLPQKNEWTLIGGVKFEGRATGFQKRTLIVQRRLGFVYVNGEKIGRLSDDPVVEFVCKENGVLSTTQLKKHLATQINAQVYIPYGTMEYMGANGHEEVPLCMLSPEDLNELRASYDVWAENEERKHQEQVFRQQQLQNEQMRNAMMLQQLNIQQGMHQAAWAQAYQAKRQASAAEDQATELRKLNDKFK